MERGRHGRYEEQNWLHLMMDSMSGEDKESNLLRFLHSNLGIKRGNMDEMAGSVWA